jgi:hypothetical protein
VAGLNLVMRRTGAWYGLALATLVLSATAPASASPNGPWSGAFTQSSGAVKVKLIDNPIRPLVVEFTDVPLDCSDGSTFLQSWTAKGELRKDSSFRIEQQFPRDLGLQTYADTRGKLKHGRIKGTFYLLRVSLEPDLVPSCATGYPLPWTARSVHK